MDEHTLRILEFDKSYFATATPSFAFPERTWATSVTSERASTGVWHSPS